MCSRSDSALACLESLAENLLRSTMPLLTSQAFLAALAPHIHVLEYRPVQERLRIVGLVLRLDAQLSDRQVAGSSLVRTTVASVLQLNAGGRLRCIFFNAAWRLHSSYVLAHVGPQTCCSETVLLKVGALRLVPYLLPGVAVQAPIRFVEAAAAGDDEVLQAFEDMMAAHFPLKSREQTTASAEAAYLSLLTESLQIVVKV